MTEPSSESFYCFSPPILRHSLEEQAGLHVFETIRAFIELLEDLERRQSSGVQKPCFMTELLASKEANFTREEIAFIAVTLLEAGSDTTRNTLLEVVAGAAMYPDWIARARAELDKVCGENAQRLPTFDDMERLPMIRAAVKEAIRWRYASSHVTIPYTTSKPNVTITLFRPTNTQTGVPHALTKDDEFEGYRLPAGTVVTWNHWGISHDPDEYDQPERFYPDRFLNDDLGKVTKGHLGFGAGKAFPFPPSSREIVFSVGAVTDHTNNFFVGRRVCVGFNVAASNLFIAIARLVYCFDIEQDPAHPVVVDKPFPLTAMEEPYKVIIKPRSEEHRKLVLNDCRDAAVIDPNA